MNAENPLNSILEEVPSEAELETGAPEPTPEPTPEPVAEAKPEPEVQIKSAEEKYQELQIALRQERAGAREAKAELEAIKARLAEVDALKEELTERRRLKAEQEMRAKFEENPAEYLREQVEANNRKIEEMTTKEQETLQKYEAEQRLTMTIATQAQQFAKEAPDYHDALNFVRDRRMKEYDLWGVPPEAREQAFLQESIQLGAQALQQGRNAAQTVYELAKTWGYAGKLTQSVEASAESKILQMQNGAKAAATLSTGTAPPRESLLSRVEDMDDDEFESFWKTDIAPKRRA